MPFSITVHARTGVLEQGQSNVRRKWAPLVRRHIKVWHMSAISSKGMRELAEEATRPAQSPLLLSRECTHS
jgi:hypothetical protein